MAANKNTHFGGHSGYGGVSKKQVDKLLKGILRDQKRQLRGQRKQVNRQAQRDRNQIRRDTASARGDLRHIFDEVSRYQQHLGEQQQNIFSDAKGRQSAAQQALQDRLSASYGGAQQGLTSELERLGIGKSANIQGLAEDAEFSQQRAMQSGANMESTMDMSQSNAAMMNNLLQGMTRGSEMSEMGRVLRQRTEGLQGVRDARQENLSRINEAMSAVNKSRPDLFFQLLNQLQETGWGQYLQGQQLQLQRDQMNR